MKYSPIDDMDKTLRSMWLGFEDNTFDVKGKKWSFTGSPYITKVGSKYSKAVAFDGATTLSSTAIVIGTIQNLSVNFWLQLTKLNPCTIFSAGDFYLKLLSDGKLQMSRLYDASSSPATSDDKLSANTLYHISVVFYRGHYSSNGTPHYCNRSKVCVNSSAWIADLEGNSYPYQIPSGTNFRNLTVGAGLYGFLSDFRIFNGQDYSVPAAKYDSSNANVVSLLQF